MLSWKMSAPESQKPGRKSVTNELCELNQFI